MGPSSAADYELHDALYDYCALVNIMETENVTVKRIADCSRSINSVISRKTNPLLRAKLITENVAAKMTEQLTCESYLAMSDEELTFYLRSIGVPSNSITVCLKKRRGNN